MSTYVKSLVLAVVALAMLSTAAASATTLTSPKGTAYTSTIEAASGEVILHSNFGAVTCKGSGLKGTVEQHGAEVPAQGSLSGMTFSECGTNDVLVESAGSLSVFATSGGEATVKSSGAKISVKLTSVGITCVYSTNETDLGALTGSNSTNATIDVEVAKIPRTGGSPFCGTSGTLTGTYKVTAPSTLSVDPASGSTLTSPEGTTYTSTIKAEGSEITIHGPATLTCLKSTAEGKVEQDGAELSVGGKLSSLTFSECGTNHVTVQSAGSLRVHAGTGGNGTVTSSGTKLSIDVTSLGITCVYMTSNTDLGMLTGSNSTNAVIDLESSNISTTVGSSVMCGSSGVLTGSYKVTTPSTLSLDPG